jgi:hypothetical protein
MEVENADADNERTEMVRQLRAKFAEHKEVDEK